LVLTHDARATTTTQLPEQDEVLGPWTYDQDPFNSKWEALGTLVLAFAGIGVLRWLAGKYNAPAQKPTVWPCICLCVCLSRPHTGVVTQATRVLPFNNLEAELGGVPASA
jgi:hypothetical protein